MPHQQQIWNISTRSACSKDYWYDTVRQNARFHKIAECDVSSPRPWHAVAINILPEAFMLTFLETLGPRRRQERTTSYLTLPAAFRQSVSNWKGFLANQWFTLWSERIASSLPIRTRVASPRWRWVRRPLHRLHPSKKEWCAQLCAFRVQWHLCKLTRDPSPRPPSIRTHVYREREREKCSFK